MLRHLFAASQPDADPTSLALFEWWANHPTIFRYPDFDAGVEALVREFAERSELSPNLLSALDALYVNTTEYIPQTIGPEAIDATDARSWLNKVATGVVAAHILAPICQMHDYLAARGSGDLHAEVMEAMGMQLFHIVKSAWQGEDVRDGSQPWPLQPVITSFHKVHTYRLELGITGPATAADAWRLAGMFSAQVSFTFTDAAGPRLHPLKSGGLRVEIPATSTPDEFAHALVWGVGHYLIRRSGADRERAEAIKTADERNNTREAVRLIDERDAEVEAFVRDFFRDEPDAGQAVAQEVRLAA